jgi:hypothetical protein
VQYHVILAMEVGAKFLDVMTKFPYGALPHLVAGGGGGRELDRSGGGVVRMAGAGQSLCGWGEGGGWLPSSVSVRTYLLAASHLLRYRASAMDSSWGRNASSASGMANLLKSQVRVFGYIIKAAQYLYPAYKY